jgi:DNA polymerase-3 subunit epsilon
LQISREIYALDWTVCRGDLGAQLLEAQEIKRLSPKYNVKLRKLTRLWSLVKQADDQGYDTLKIVSLDGLFAEQLAGLYGLYRSKKQAESALETLVNAQGLCHRLAGLEKKKTGACFAHQLTKCKGACVAKEPPLLYNLRQSLGLRPLQQKAWPWPGAVLVHEHSIEADDCDAAQLIHQWCWLGTVHSAQEVADVLDVRPRHDAQHYQIDLDQYRILCKFLLTPPQGVSVTPVTQALLNQLF